MQTFISETLDDILQTTSSFENVIFVLPSQRAGVFLKQKIKNKISTGFLPEIINIEQFTATISEVKKIDSIQLLFHFYTIYTKLENTPDSFDAFSSWAFTVLQDFNEMDQHLIKTKDIFNYIRDIERLKKWSVKGTFKETDLIKNNTLFLEKMNTYYIAFYQFLKENNIGYQGLLYREATKNCDAYIEKNKHKKFFFIGFNALNKAEEFLFQKMLSAGNSEIYWDIDTAFLTGNHQAGTFIRKYKKEWHYYEKNELKQVGNHFSATKNIKIIGAAKNVMQIKYAGEILQKLPNHQQTALVLADETLLPITLNSLPKNVEAINITMGYPLKDIPTTSLILSIFQLFLTQQKLQKTAVNLFYYKDVIRIFKQATIYKLITENNKDAVTEITEKITLENNLFISQKHLSKFLEKLDTKTQEIKNLFDPFLSIIDFLERIIQLITLLKEDVNSLEKEYLFRFYTTFKQLQNLQTKFQYFQDLKTLHHFFKQLISSETLSFQGEPLQGLQLMGMLETRVLDFENVIITSVNEGVLPQNSSQNSFIPFDVKVAFGLPTYREKDAVFSYHFFRLLQRAKNIYLLYNTEHDSFGSGEKSRFLTQLELMIPNISHTIISPKVVTEKIESTEIFKNNAILEKLQELAEKGISPSAFTNYLYNPIAFYKKKVLKIKEFQSVEEIVAANTLGTVVHETLDFLYKPFIGKFLIATDIELMQKQVNPLVLKYFSKFFKNGDISTGKNRLIFEVANRFVQNFLSQEKKIVSDENNRLKIISLEDNLHAYIKVDGISFPIKIHGKVDRIDELNGVTRIIDYKTGMVNSSNLKVVNFENIRELKHHKAIQVLLYAFLYTQNRNFNFSKPLEAGVISFKNLKSGFLKVNFSSNYRNPETQITSEKIEEFIEEVKVLLLEMYNPEVSFLEPADLPY